MQHFSFVLFTLFIFSWIRHSFPFARNLFPPTVYLSPLTFTDNNAHTHTHIYNNNCKLNSIFIYMNECWNSMVSAGEGHFLYVHDLARFALSFTFFRPFTFISWPYHAWLQIIIHLHVRLSLILNRKQSVWFFSCSMDMSECIKKKTEKPASTAAQCIKMTSVILYEIMGIAFVRRKKYNDKMKHRAWCSTR